MRSFLNVNDRAFKTVQIVGGPRTRAVLHPASDNPQLNDQFLSPKMIAKVKPGSLIQPGQLLTYNGEHYLTGAFRDTSEWLTYVLFHCDRQVTWARPASTTDPTTGLPKASGPPTSLGSIWVYWERVLRAPYDETTRLPNIDYVVATAAAVQPGDLIAGNTIQRYDTALGLTILGLKA